MQYKINYIGYDLYKLAPDLGPGSLLASKHLKGFASKRFKSETEALKYAAKRLGTSYRRGDWNFETDLDDDGDGGWVLHIIVDKKMRWANEKMIEKWKESKIELQDLLANVFISPCEEKPKKRSYFGKTWNKWAMWDIVSYNGILCQVSNIIDSVKLYVLREAFGNGEHIGIAEKDISPINDEQIAEWNSKSFFQYKKKDA